MFEWLKKEIAQIKTPNFHIVDGPADARLEEAVTQSNLPLPPSYSQFVLEFGNAKLYRRSRRGYTIQVFAGPRESVLMDGTKVYYLGSNDGAKVYVKASNSRDSIPVFEFDEGEERMAGDFGDWLLESSSRARRHYKKKWNEILRGPEPFNAEEEELIATRRKMRWRVIGIDEQSNLIFEITNAGSGRLPFLTVGIKSTDGKLNGAARLDTHEIAPGQTALIHRDCYKQFRPAEEIQAFALPDPGPEDRDYYFEFQKPRSQTDDFPPNF